MRRRASSLSACRLSSISCLLGPCSISSAVSPRPQCFLTLHSSRQRMVDTPQEVFQAGIQASTTVVSLHVLASQRLAPDRQNGLQQAQRCRRPCAKSSHPSMPLQYSSPRLTVQPCAVASPSLAHATVSPHFCAPACHPSSLVCNHSAAQGPMPHKPNCSILVPLLCSPALCVWQASTGL